MKWIAAILVLYLTSCADSKRNDVGRFVYVDCFNTIHIDIHCAANLAEDPKTKDERIADMQGIQFIDTCDLKEGLWYCPKCVDDETTFDCLRKIILKNKEIDNDRRWVYHKLIQAGYDMEEYELFIHHLSNHNRRQRLFRTAQNEGWDVGTYEDFSTLLGFEETNQQNKTL